MARTTQAVSFATIRAKRATRIEKASRDGTKAKLSALKITKLLHKLYDVNHIGGNSFYNQNEDGFPAAIAKSSIDGREFDCTIATVNQFDSTDWKGVKKLNSVYGAT
jgi:hypothetical protein